MPSARAFSSEAITTAAAPSFRPDELPAVTEPPSRNAGLSEASFSADVSGRGCSSRVDVADRHELVVEPSGVGGRSPALLRAQRERVLVLARDAQRSATFSPVSPIVSSGKSASSRGLGKRQPSVVSYSVRSPRGNAASGFAVTSGARDIDSTPPATKRSPSPAITAWHAPTIAASPDAHSRLTVTPRDRLGQPGEQHRHAGDVAVVLAGLVGAAEPDVLDLLGRHPARSTAARTARRRGRRGAFAARPPP